MKKAILREVFETILNLRKAETLRLLEERDLMVRFLTDEGATVKRGSDGAVVAIDWSEKMKEADLRIRLDQKHSDEIDAIAAASEVTRSEVARILLRDALERFRKSRRKRVTL